MSEGPKTLTLLGRAAEVTGVAFSPDGRILAASNGTTVKVWDVTTRERLMTLAGHGEEGGDDRYIYCVAFSPDGKRIASGSGNASGGGEMMVWEIILP